MKLTERHVEILRAIGVSGAMANELVRYGAFSREFDDLRHAGLIVFWPDGKPRPETAFGGTYAGSWCLTFDGLSAAGIEPPPLRLAN